MGVKVNDVVKIKAGRWKGFAGVVESVEDDGAVMVRIEGVRDSLPFVAVVRVMPAGLELRA